ncbi:MAG: hypothetical protein E7254_07735 [Lachnospiraceae bacterium]|nr:hypothetical protein [Lachnospiraceae bacterium]
MSKKIKKEQSQVNRKLELKKETADYIDIMIRQAEKGPSGFWTEDYEGCGNPKIFPEFNEGLEHGRLIQKKHFLCPWNAAVLFANGRGNISTGCYHSCSIIDAKYLSTDMIKEVLIKFKKNMLNGYYDNPKEIGPLLTGEMIKFIESAKEAEREAIERREQKEYNQRKQMAKKLLERFSDDKNAQQFIVAHYGGKTVNSSEYGMIDFSPESKDDVVGAENMSYDDYLEVQIRTVKKCRIDFQNCFYNTPMEFKGCIEKKNSKRVCFERIFVTGMFSSGFEMFDGKEDHVWMDIKGFEDLEVGDCVSFFAEVYRYIKTSNGKVIDFGLRNPKGIKRIEKYELPTDEELMRQSIDRIICDSCYLNEMCSGADCIRNSKEL